MRAKPSAIAVLPTPASPTYSGLFLRRRHRISMVRSISSLRPMSGSMRPSWAWALRLTAYFSSAVALLVGLRLAGARQAVGDEIHHIEPGDLGARQQEPRVALLLAEDRD